MSFRYFGHLLAFEDADLMAQTSGYLDGALLSHTNLPSWFHVNI